MAHTSLIPGFRFHPTDVELVMYYLKRKLLGKKITVNAIVDVNIYDLEPWDLPDRSDLKSGDLEWFFFCPTAKKYSRGGRSNRATEAGFWKATGKDKVVKYNGRTVATIKTLVFHIGHKGKGERTDWVMHEYKMEDEQLASAGIIQDTNVLCKVFKKSGLGPKNGAQYGAQFNEEEWDDLVGCGDFQMAVDPVGATVSTNTQTENGSASGVSYANNMTGNGLVNGVPSANNMTENGSVGGILTANACTNTPSLVAPQNTHGMLVSEPGSSSGGRFCVTETQSDMLAIDDYILFEDLDLLLASEDEAATNVKQVNTAPDEDDIYKILGSLIDVDHLNGIDFKTDGADYTFDELTSLDELEAFYVE